MLLAGSLEIVLKISKELTPPKQIAADQLSVGESYPKQVVNAKVPSLKGHVADKP